MRKMLIVLTIFFLGNGLLRAQTVHDLFEARENLSRNHSAAATKYQGLELKKERLQSLHAAASPQLTISLPFEDGIMELELKKVQITSSDFLVTESRANGPDQSVQVDMGVFYHGKIKGKPNSIASISIVKNEVIGVMSDGVSNIVLGAVESNLSEKSEYVMYREQNLTATNPNACFTDDVAHVINPTNHAPQTSNTPPTTANNFVGAPIEIYVELDYKLYQDRGSSTANAVNYVLGVFNNVSLLYANENLLVQVSHIKVWTTMDPEGSVGHTSSSNVLYSFRDRLPNTTYKGDYAHFLSGRSIGGGVAYVIPNPCATERKYLSAVSGNMANYQAFPTYSWAVMVVTHEIGHNFGSNHTQWCGWVGGAIDNCVPTEPVSEGGASCPRGPAPVNGGTIMSYCHQTASGINLANGFGPQPGDRIRQVLGGATCWANCQMTIGFDVTDASCNQANGTVTVNATNSTGTLTYLWSTGHTGATLTNAAPGVYYVTVTDGSGCKVTDDVTIGNSGTTLNFGINTGSVAALCAGGTLTVQATNNPAYTYQWYKDNIAINGATSSTYNITQTGNYSVTANSGACSGTVAFQVVSAVAAPGTITNSGGLTFCSGITTTLSSAAGSSYTYQWFKNNTAITGATSSSLEVGETGTYYVEISAGSCKTTSNSFSITVNPTPVATHTNTGSLTFCEGGSVTFNAGTGTGYVYQWMRDNVNIAGATSATYVANTSGSYKVAITSGNCNAASTAQTVTVLARPVVTLTPAVSTIEKFSTQTITASGANSYNWSSLPDMVSSTTSSGTYRPLTTTQYTVEGLATNGCRSTSNAIINVIGCGPISNFNTQTYSPSRVFLSWTNPQGATSDSVMYRITGTNTWTKLFVEGNSVELNGLQPGANYEYRIIPLCTTTNTFVASPSQALTTAPLTDGRYIRLFPNPVSETARLEVIADSVFDIDIAIYDNTGKLVRPVVSSKNTAAGQSIFAINASTLANGVYMISVNMGGKKEVIKMVVAH